MKTFSIKSVKYIKALLAFFVLILLVSSCKREEVDPFGKLEVFIHTQDTTGKNQNTFKYGEDINFVITELNSSYSEIRYARSTNTPSRRILVVGEDNGVAGRLVKRDALEILIYQVYRLSRGETNTVENNWFNKYMGNSPLPVGKYKAIYEDSYIMHDRYREDYLFGSPREGATYRAEISFEVK
jgi:hypothetical protein